MVRPSSCGDAVRRRDAKENIVGFNEGLNRLEFTNENERRCGGKMVLISRITKTKEVLE